MAIHTITGIHMVMTKATTTVMTTVMTTAMTTAMSMLKVDMVDMVTPIAKKICR